MTDNHRKSTKRSILADVLPLEAPFVVHIDVASACNFKCKFCFHSLPENQLKELGFVPGIMEPELFRLAVDRIKEFPKPLARLCLIRHGESLLNRELPGMIRYAKEAGVAEKINISTNGSLLTPEIGQALLDAGLDEMLVSIEALSSEAYREICGVDVDFDGLVRMIGDFYRRKRQASLYVKIIEYAFDEQSKERFHSIFDPICDQASVEQIIPCFRGVDYSAFKKEYTVNIMGDEFQDIKVCPQPFFQLHIFPNGNVSICNADYNEKLVFGNIRNDSLLDIWRGEDLNRFRLMQLEGKRLEHEYCRFCASNVCYSSKSDILDEQADQLRKYYR